MLLLGIDLGTSFIKVSVVDADTQQALATVQYPDKEAHIKSLQFGWAEQEPETWWYHLQKAILLAHQTRQYDPLDIAAIGISYQMHGLVVVDKSQNVLRDAIIWCDSRAVEIGKQAFEKIGADKSLSHLLNSPGNFTASKLAWVKQNEPQIYAQIDKVMLPGDFIAMKLTGQISTTASALSEGILWDFKTESLSQDVLDCYGFNADIFPPIKDVFTPHATITSEIAELLSLKADIPVSYKAGDQPNNALSLNVLKPGEVAATAGTSGVIYGVSNTLKYDPLSRVNTFAHVNYTPQNKRLGVLLCINGTGIMYRWVRDNVANGMPYNEMNHKAQYVEQGSNGLIALPFGNGAERILNNQLLGAQFLNLDLNKHTQAHIFRAVQEGICFAFRYGLDIMRQTGITPKIIKAGKANLFLSDVFTQIFVNVCNTPVELYKNDGSIGAALGAGVGVNIFANFEAAFTNMKPLKLIKPEENHSYEELYQNWKTLLESKLIK